MDTIFLLDMESRTRVLEQAARRLGCVYICLWSPLNHPSSDVLACMEAWIREPDGSSLSSMNFEAYRRSFCTIVSGCVPGWAFKERLLYFELSESSLMSSASSQVQEQFYRTAIFMGCQNGEIEIGMTSSTLANLQVRVQQVFSEDFIQQMVFDELLQLRSQQRVCSSSSSIPSLSVGSPEYSSLININTSLSPKPLTPLMQTFQQNTSYNQYINPNHPTPESDDMAMARAMLAVISSSTASTSSSCQVGERKAGSSSAFKPYKSDFGPIKTSGVGSQNMIKRVVALSRRLFFMRSVRETQQEAVVRPTSGQLHHVISERKRREKLNERFDALRKLLPPGSKRDKASVLVNTKDYLNTLIKQISELEERNKNLEAQLNRSEQTLEIGESSERVQVAITRASESNSSSQRINLHIVLRDIECDFNELIIRTLECLKKEISLSSLVSVDASSESPRFARANITLSLSIGDYDEKSLKETVKKAIEDAAERPEAL
ncbi:hypothetical protein LUZ60_012351 [Juncus effusus]|nr:hypothetical protein LUZ60_012351 [Juncus effusus]